MAAVSGPTYPALLPYDDRAAGTAAGPARRFIEPGPGISAKGKGPPPAPAPTKKAEPKPTVAAPSEPVDTESDAAYRSADEYFARKDGNRIVAGRAPKDQRQASSFDGPLLLGRAITAAKSNLEAKSRALAAAGAALNGAKDKLRAAEQGQDQEAKLEDYVKANGRYRTALRLRGDAQRLCDELAKELHPKPDELQPPETRSFGH